MILYYLWLLILGYSIIPPVHDLSHTPGRAFKQVGDQETCGACTAFAITNAYSMRLLIAEGIDYQPSPHQLMSCYKINCTNHVTIPWIILNIYDMELPDDNQVHPKSYDFASCNHSLTKSDIRNVAYKIIMGFDSIEAEIFLRGPIVAPMIPLDGPPSHPENHLHCEHLSFLSHSNPQMGHMVVVVGWGKHKESNNEFWIIKNSWGDTWGDSGYGKVHKNCIIYGLSVTPRRSESPVVLAEEYITSLMLSLF